MNRWKSGYSKFVSLKPLSQQNRFLSLKVQASSEIIWFEMLFRRDHRTLRRLSLCTFRFHEIEPSLCTFLFFRTIISTVAHACHRKKPLNDRKFVDLFIFFYFFFFFILFFFFFFFHIYFNFVLINLLFFTHTKKIKNKFKKYMNVAYECHSRKKK